MATIAALVVDLTANTAKFNAGLKGASAQTKAFKAQIASMRAGLARIGNIATVVGVALAGVFVKGSIQNAIEAEDAFAQLEAGIESTGGAAGFAARELADIATDLQDITTFGDEAIKKTQAMLLTFTQIKGDVFEETTLAVLDMSVRLDQDLKSSVIQVGKALNDPVLGITALGRVGIQFTDDTKKLIKTLVEEGNVLEAQKIILKELTTEFGGSAVAAAKTLGGQLQQLNNQWQDLKEVVGIALGPILKSIVEFLRMKGVMQVLLVALGALVAGFVVYKIAAFAVTIANIALSASIPIVGWASLAAGVAVAAAALVGLAVVMKDAGVDSEELDEQIKKIESGTLGAATGMDTLTSSTAKFDNKLQSLNNTLGQWRDKMADLGMSDAEKKLVNFDRQIVAFLKSNKAAIAALSPDQKKSLGKAITDMFVESRRIVFSEKRKRELAQAAGVFGALNSIGQGTETDLARRQRAHRGGAASGDGGGGAALAGASRPPASLLFGTAAAFSKETNQGRSIAGELKKQTDLSREQLVELRAVAKAAERKARIASF